MSTEIGETSTAAMAPGYGLSPKQSWMVVLLVLGSLAAVPVMVSIFQKVFPEKPWAGDAAAAAAAPVDGAALFVAKCAACHGAEGKGLPNLGKDMTTSEFIKGLDNLDLMAFVKKGRPIDDPKNTTKVAMPPKGGHADLTDEEILAIIYHIRDLK